MPVITAMRPRRGGHGRVTLELDGADWRVASYEAVAETGVEVGWDLDARRLRELERALDERAAFESALRILAVRPRTADDLARRLTAKGVAAAHAQAAVARCDELALIDEAEVLRARARTLRARGLGRRRAEADIAALGGTPDDQRAALDAVFPVGEAPVIAEEAARRLARSGRGDDAARERLVGRLVRLGHAPDDARRAARRVMPRDAVDPLPAASDDPEPTGATRPRELDDDALRRALAVRYRRAIEDPAVRRRAWGWAARRGATPEQFRRCLEAAAGGGGEAEG